MDNEAANELKAILKYKLSYQLTPPHIHCINAAERAIHTFKNNFRINPSLPAYAIINGNYDFNKSPMAPPDTKIITNKKLIHRASWDFHGDDGYYVGLALEHY